MVAVAAALAAKAQMARAQIPQYNWTGNGSTPYNWSDNNNWGGSAPGYGILYFSGANGTTNTVDSGWAENVLQWNNAAGWTLNSANGGGITLYDYGGSQSKLENLGSGSVTVNAPITFNANTGNPYAEINAISGDFTFAAGGTINVSGSILQGLRFWGTSAHTTYFDNTLNDAGLYITTPGGGNISIGSTGNVTAGTVSIINGAALTLSVGGVLTTNLINLGDDLGESGFSNTSESAAFNLAGASGGITVANTVEAKLNSSGAVDVNSQNTSGVNTLAGRIALDGNLAINQAGGGTLLLSNTNIASNAGGIDLEASALTLGGSGTIDVSGVVYSDSNSGSAALNYAGTGTLVLASSNAYTGTTTISSGLVRLDNVNATGSSTVIVNTNNGLTFSPGGPYILGGLGGTGNIALTATDASAIAVSVGSNNANSTLSGAISGNGSLTKTGSGTLTLAGSDTYLGATTINAGVLSLDHSGTNVGQLTSSPVTVTANGTLNAKGNAIIGSSLISSGSISLVDGSINTLTVGGGLSLNSSVLSFELGSGADRITSTGAATIAGTNTINLSLVPGQTASAGNYVLLSASSGLTAGGGGFTIGTKPAGFFNFSLSQSTTTQEILTVAGNPTPSTAYWTGLASTTGSPSDPFGYWSYGSSFSTPKSNWSTTANGTSDPLQVPGSNTNVIFAATNASPNVSTSLNTVLDAAFSVKSITFNEPSTTGITQTVVNTNGNTLTLGSGGLAVASASFSGGIIAGSGTVNLLTNENFANNNNNQSLTVNAPITAGTSVSTLNFNGTGTGGVAINGGIGNGASSSLAVVFNQAGVTQLNGSDTFTGGLFINSGSVQLGNASAINPSAAVVTFGAGSTGALLINGNSVTLSDLNTNAAIGTPVISNGTSSSAGTLTVSTSNIDTFGGALQDGSGGGTLALTKAGPGTLILTGSGSYSGATTINAGTLQIGSNGTAGALSNNTAVNFGSGNSNTLAFALTNNPTFAGNIFMTAGSNENGNVYVASGDTVNLTGAITGNGGEFWATGPGTVIITPNAGSASDNSSNVVENGGTLSLSDFTSSTLGNGNFYIGAGGTSGAISYTGASTSTARIGAYFLQGTSNYIGVTNPTTTLTVSAAIGQTANNNLTKTGSGTLLLSSANTYSGVTDITGGALDITGAIADSGTITIDATSASSTLILDGAFAVSSSAPLTGIAGAFVPTITVNAPQALASINSVGTTNFTAGTSTVNSVAGAGTFEVASGATVLVLNSLNQTAVVSAGSLSLSGGGSNIVGVGNGVGRGTGSLNVGGIDGGGTLSVSSATSLTAAHIRQTMLNIDATSTVSIADSAAPGNTAATSVLTDLSNAGTLDLNNNDLIVTDTTQYSTVKNLIVSAFDGGAWDKAGITSSSARANASAYGLGYAQASTIGSTSFDGQAFTDAVLVKYTLLGDSQLRGTVGLGDYDTVLSNYGAPQDWSGGDFHYGGVVGIGDYDDVLSNYGAHASGNLAALTRSISPAASISPAGINPDLAKTDLKLEVNTTTGDVYILTTASAAFSGYTISDPSAHLLGGSTSPDPDKLLSVSAGNGGNTNVYETSGTYVDWFKITETASQVAEGQQQNGFGTHSSRDDTINIPAGGTIDFGDIYNTAAAQQDLTFDFAEAGTEPTNGPTYYGAEVDYITSSTPEPASVSLLAIGALGMLARRRRTH
jgi:autotransporter-associated beta strand protein